jgi:hypothetical protein
MTTNGAMASLKPGLLKVGFPPPLADLHFEPTSVRCGAKPEAAEVDRGLPLSADFSHSP